MPTSCRRPLTFFLALVIAVSSATALASSDADADTLVQRAAKGEPAAVAKLLELARAGDAEAYLYNEGLDVARDYKEAFTWYRKAAEQDEPTALFDVGFMYEEARGVARNIAEAFRYYQKAAERGHQEARRILGNTAR